MKTRAWLLIAITALGPSSTALAQGGMGMQADAGMPGPHGTHGPHGMQGMHGGQGGCMMMGGGNLTRAQFLERAEAHFTAMDTNKDGVLDAAEHQQMHAHMQGCMGMMGGAKTSGGHAHGPGEAAPPTKP